MLGCPLRRDQNNFFKIILQFNCFVIPFKFALLLCFCLYLQKNISGLIYPRLISLASSPVSCSDTASSLVSASVPGPVRRRLPHVLQQPRQPLRGVRLPQLEAVRHPHPVPKQRESTRQIFFHVYKYFPRFNTQHRVVQWFSSPSTRARTPPPTPPSRATAAASQTPRGCPRPAATTASAKLRQE